MGIAWLLGPLVLQNPSPALSRLPRLCLGSRPPAQVLVPGRASPATPPAAWKEEQGASCGQGCHAATLPNWWVPCAQSSGRTGRTGQKPTPPPAGVSRTCPGSPGHPDAAARAPGGGAPPGHRDTRCLGLPRQRAARGGPTEEAAKGTRLQVRVCCAVSAHLARPAAESLTPSRSGLLGVEILSAFRFSD